MNMVYLFICIVSFFHQHHGFQSTAVSHSWLNLFLGVLFFLMQLQIFHLNLEIFLRHMDGSDGEASDFAGHDLMVRAFEPCVRISAVSMEPTSDPLSPFLCPSAACTLSKINKHLKSALSLKNANYHLSLQQVIIFLLVLP